MAVFWRLSLSGLLALGCVFETAEAAVYTVTNAFDSGAGSLRAAIAAANAHTGADEIHFKITGSGVHTITVKSALPGITSPLLIDGYSQSGSSVNTLGVGTNALLLIELRTDSASVSGLSLLAGSTGSTIRGLVINRFYGAQINVPAGDNCVITGNFIGTDPTGTLGYPGSPGTRTGIVVGADGCRVGGQTNADRNLVSGLSLDGIYISGDNAVVQGNLVGTTAGGSAALPNGTGIEIGATNSVVDTRNALIGGFNSGSPTQVPRNVISGNLNAGIEIVSGEGHRVLGNIIGLAAFPIFDIPNGGPGIRIVKYPTLPGPSQIDIGSPTTGEDNAIVGNSGPGVLISGPAAPDAPQGVWVVGNSIFDNGGLAIDLAVNGAQGVTANDPLDADAGPNTLQNFPVLTSVSYGSGLTVLSGSLDSAASQQYRLELYTTAVCDAGGHGGADTRLGSATVTTNSSGHADFVFAVGRVLDSGFATATASSVYSDSLATSEFSNCLGLGDLIFADGFESP